MSERSDLLWFLGDPVDQELRYTLRLFLDTLITTHASTYWEFIQKSLSIINVQCIRLYKVLPRL